ncbi:MAG: hypothetical protein LBF69_05275 [Prevotellaceae bacterium]|jgi:hypothetical protein|nr:hypothetical protein [Prevotellaceae bacterium]
MKNNNKNTATGKKHSTPASTSNETTFISDTPFIRKEIVVFMEHVFHMRRWGFDMMRIASSCEDSNRMIGNIENLNEGLDDVINAFLDIVSTDFIDAYYKRLYKSIPSNN